MNRYTFRIYAVFVYKIVGRKFSSRLMNGNQETLIIQANYVQKNPGIISEVVRRKMQRYFKVYKPGHISQIYTTSKARETYF